MTPTQTRLALYSLQQLLVHGRKLAFENDGDPAIVRLLDEIEVLPQYIAHGDQDRFEQSLRQICKELNAGFVWQIYERGEVSETW